LGFITRRLRHHQFQPHPGRHLHELFRSAARARVGGSVWRKHAGREAAVSL